MNRNNFLPGLALLILSSGCVSMQPKVPPPDINLDGTDTAVDSVTQTARELTAGAATDAEKAQRLYVFVRNEIEYGFTKRFDAADPAFTLAKGRGHCNPQTELMVTLLRAVGLDARQRFVTIDPDILDGLLPPQAGQLEELNHSYTEVWLDNRWVRIDGYAVDPALLRGARARLVAEGRVAGYGVHVDSCSEWDGASDCMAQFVDPDWQRQLYDPIEPAKSFYSTDGYSQRMGKVTGFFYQTFGVPQINRKLNRLRNSDVAAPPAAATGLASRQTSIDEPSPDDDPSPGGGERP